MKFELVTATPDGVPSTTVIVDAASEVDALGKASTWGMQVKSVQAWQAEREPANRFALLQFCQELLALLNAGMNMYEALSTLAAKECGSKAALLRALISGLASGASLSEVLQRHDSAFPDIFIASVRAAERSGDVPTALERFIEYQSQLDTIRKKVQAAAVYPCALLLVGTSVSLFLLGYVVPRFSGVYQSSGRDIPWLSQQLLGFGKIVATNVWILGAGAGALAMLVAWLLSRSEVRVVLLGYLLRIPFLHVKVRQFRLARFYRAVSLLVHSGIPISKALEMGTGLLDKEQQACLVLARQSVAQGNSLSAAMVANHLATPVAESLMRVGERSGRLGDMLERAARFQDEEFARWIEVTARLLEPALMTIMGVIIGGIVVLMYMPIFDLAGALG